MFKKAGIAIVATMLAANLAMTDAQARSSTSFTISLNVPVKCSVSMNIQNASTGGQIYQDCNTDHVVNVQYDPALLPQGQNVTLRYNGRNVTLDQSGQVRLSKDGPIRQRRSLSLVTDGGTANLEPLLQSFQVRYSTL